MLLGVKILVAESTHALEGQPVQGSSGAGHSRGVESRSVERIGVQCLAGPRGSAHQRWRSPTYVHTFAVEEGEIDDNLPNGSLVESRIADTVQPGQTFTFYCSEHRDEGMEGMLTIR